MERKNFPFVYEGNEYWYSRSIACITVFVTSDREYNFYVLATKRGKGAAGHQGEWCIPGGYLDHGESCEQASLRELFEETGVDLRKEENLPYEVLSDPQQSSKQDVIYVTKVYKMNALDIPFSKENNEPDEVEEIKWIPIEDLDKYTWAFNYKDKIFSIIRNLQYVPSL